MSTIQKGDRVVFMPFNIDVLASDFTPPIGTEGLVLYTFYIQGSKLAKARVKWDTYGATTCLVRDCIKEKDTKMPIQDSKTNADRNLCFRCGKPTKLMNCGLASSKLKYCPSCKI